MTAQGRKWWVRLAVLAVAGLAALSAWERYGANHGNEGIASGNGRIEAVEIDVATKVAGRIVEISVREGDFVTAGQVVARMDTEVLEAQRRQAEAQLQQARSAAATARSQLAQREAEKAAAIATVHQREAELDVAEKRSRRSAALATRGAGSQQDADEHRGLVLSASAGVSAARAQVAAADAAIATAQSQVSGAESSITAAQSSVERIQADIADSALKAPRAGRVQYRVAEVGEVLGAGGRVLNLIDLSDVYMTFFLPTAAAGRVALGAEVRLVLDAAPDYVVPAEVSFVASEAQFTPKTVETASEREKLMFRVRARIPIELLQRHITQVKTGLPGMAHVKLDPGVPWPERLERNLVR